MADLPGGSPTVLVVAIDSADDVAGSAVGGLVDQLAAHATQPVAVDQAPDWVDGDLADYVTAILADPDSPYCDTPMRAAELARAIEGLAGR